MGAGYGWGGFGSEIGILVVLAALALIVVGIILLVRGFSGRPASSGSTRPQETPPTGGANPAMRILEERYARGEIDRDEFLRRKQDLLG